MHAIKRKQICEQLIQGHAFHAPDVKIIKDLVHAPLIAGLAACHITWEMLVCDNNRNMRRVFARCVITRQEKWLGLIIGFIRELLGLGSIMRSKGTIDKPLWCEKAS